MLMNELNGIFSECKDQLANIGYNEVLNNQYQLLFNSKLKHTLGNCRRVSAENYIITINSIYSDLNPEGAKETVMHELIHSINGCMDHKEKWKAIACKVNWKYGYQIQRITDAGNEYREQVYNKTYILKCSGCGQEIYREKFTKTIQHPELYKCGCCGNSFTRIK